MKTEMPEISTILTHIESEPATIRPAMAWSACRASSAAFRPWPRCFPEVVDMHDLMFKRVDGRLHLSLHCTMSDDLPLSRVHDIQTAMEGKFRREMPELFRVLIHPEPQTDNRR